MTDHHTHDTQPRAQDNGHGGHGWMMIVCCIPMLVIAVALVATGVADAGFLVVAIGCTVMMALMMRGMAGMDRAGGDRR